MSFTALSTGGQYKHTLTVNEMPSHAHLVGHSFDSAKGANSPINGTMQRMLYNQGNQYGSQAKPVGGSGSHNNIQPYIVTYFWRRTA